jgi:hypothetical protein
MLSKYLRRADTTLMLTPYLRKADTTNMLLPYFRDADTTSLNLTNRFATKQNTLNGTGFVKASGTNITYDNSSYLTTSSADSTYLPLTGGTLTGTLNGTIATFSNQVNLGYSNGFTGSGILTDPGNISGIKLYDGGLGSMTIFNKSISPSFGHIIFSTGNSTGNSSGVPSERMRVTYEGNVSITNNATIGGTLGVTGAATLSSTLAVTGDITEGGNNVLTSADTTTMLAPYIEQGDTTTILNPYWRSGKFSGTLPIANGGTGAESASLARTTLAVGYVFVEVTAGSSVILTSNRVSIVNTGGFSATQLDLTPATNGRMYMIKNLASGTVISDASNVIPFNGGSAGTAILGAGNVTPQWCTLVADGTNWHIIQRN